MSLTHLGPMNILNVTASSGTAQKPQVQTKRAGKIKFQALLAGVLCKDAQERELSHG